MTACADVSDGKESVSGALIVTASSDSFFTNLCGQLFQKGSRGVCDSRALGVCQVAISTDESEAAGRRAHTTEGIGKLPLARQIVERQLFVGHEITSSDERDRVKVDATARLTSVIDECVGLSFDIEVSIDSYLERMAVRGGFGHSFKADQRRTARDDRPRPQSERSITPFNDQVHGQEQGSSFL